MTSKNTILGISLALVMLVVGSVPLGFSEPLRVQLEQGIESNQIQCSNYSHVLVERTNGNLACVSERTADKTGWEIIEINDNSITNTKLETSVSTEFEPTLTTETPVLSDKQLSITNVGKEGQGQNIGNIMGHSNVYFWPQHTLSFPAQVRVGESFDVVLDYAFLTPTIDDNEFGVEFNDWSDPLRVCPEKACGDDKITISAPSNVDLIDRADYVFRGSGTDTKYIPNITYEAGTVHPQFNNSAPQQETFTFVINEPTHDYNYGDFSVSYPQSGMEKIYFYIDAFEIVHLSDVEIPVQLDASPFSLSGSSAAELGMKGYESNFIPELGAEPGIVYPDRLLQEVYTFEESIPENITYTDPSIDFLLEIVAGLKEQFPDRNVEDMLRELNFTSSLYDEFFNLHPEFRKQSINPFVQYFTIPQAFGQASPTSFVYGTLKHYDATGSLVTLGNIKICAYDTESGTLTELLNGATHICTISSSTGSFSLQSIPMNDPIGSGSTDLILKAFAQNDNFIFYKDNNPTTNVDVDIHSITSSEVRRDFPKVYSYGDFTLASSSFASKAMKTITILEPIRDWYISNSLTTPPQLPILWDPSTCRGAGVEPNTLAKTLTLEDTRRTTDQGGYEDCKFSVISPLTSQDTLAHEYAHVQFYHAYDAKNSDYPQYYLNDYLDEEGKTIYIHSPVHATPAAATWVEGWAFFMAVAYGLDDGNPSNDGIYQPSYMTGQWNFETRVNTEIISPIWAGKSFVTGIEGEGNVAAILYDAIDTTNESGDTLSNQLTNIWNTMKDNKETGEGETIIATDFLEFYNDWNDSSRPNFDSIFTLNTIPVAASCTPEVSNGFVFYDHFTCDLANWTQSGGNEMWEVKVPDERQRPHMAIDNNVANAADCDTDCNLTMTNPMSLLGKSSASIEFWRYIDTSVDGDEGLRLEVSTDNTNWTELGRWTENSGAENDAWTKETISLNSYLQNNVKLRFVALASSAGEEVEIDDILIRASTGGGGCSPNCPNPNGDDDGDGIANNIDTGVNTFSDGTTSGQITTRGGQTFTIVDASAPDGVTISTVSTGGDNTISSTDVCNAKATLTMNNRDSVTATCGSVILEGTGSSFGVVYIADNGKTFSTRITNGDKVTFDETIPSLSTTGSSSSLSVTINGQVYSLSPGSTFTLPTSPRSLSSLTPVGDKQVSLSWSAPSDNGGIPITGYIIQHKLSSNSIWSDKIIGDITSGFVDNLTNGLSYDFRVNATNPVGTGPASSIIFATPESGVTIPDAPTILTATAINATSVVLSWNAPENTGGSSITGYKIERHLNDSESGFVDLVADTGSVSVNYTDKTLLADDTAKYRVSAINGIGTSESSNEAEATTTPPKTKYQFTGIIRDFSSTHPNMQQGCSPGCQIHEGIVESSLDADGKPVFLSKGNDHTLTNAADFNQWYRTIEGVNLEKPYTIELTQRNDDFTIYSFDSGPGFFPIDGEMLGNEGRSHNYHFTIEFHSTFAFDDPTPIDSPNQSFTFKGDDDVWVYVNGTLILDIGGVHPVKSKTFTALQLMAEPFNLLPDTIYDLDLFFAERQTVQSNFRIDTTINFAPSFTLGTFGDNSQNNLFVQKVIDISSYRNVDRSTNDVLFYQTSSAIFEQNSVVRIDLPANLIMLKGITPDDDDTDNNNFINITRSDRIPDPVVVSGGMAGPLIEIGDPNHEMNFDKAVKVTLFGQAGNSAFYIDSDNVTHLIPECPELADSEATTIYLNDNSLGECYHDSPLPDDLDLIIWTMHFTGFGSASTILDSNSKKSNGDSNEWMKKPTFGASHKTELSVVECGFSWDGICYDITDNWHTPFEKVSITTGTLHNMTMKAHFEYPPLFMEFGLVPELEAYHKSETKIEVIFENDFNNYYQPDDDTTDVIIKSIAVIQNENLIDESLLSGTISKVSCGYTTSDCYELSINNIMFRDVPYFEKIGIIAADTERRFQITYLNDGFNIDGISLNPANTDIITHHSKVGSFKVIQLDRFENLWADEDGIIYTHNDVKNWIRLTPITFERNQDPETSVMTRMHSDFGGLIEQQRLIAEQTFAEKFGDYTNDEPLTFTSTDYTKHYDVIDRESDTFEQYITLQEEIAQQYLDSLSTTD